MQSQNRVDRYRSDGDLWQLLTAPVDMTPAREKYVCVGIAQWTSIAINKYLKKVGRLGSPRSVAYAGPVSCGAFDHMATGIVFAPGLSGAQPNRGYKPMLAYADGTNAQIPVLQHCDAVFDWWYSLNPLSPRIFGSQEEFNRYTVAPSVLGGTDGRSFALAR